MIHQDWESNRTIKTIECVHTNAQKFKVDTVLTPGNTYEVKNETDEFYFVIDNTNRIAGFKKEYFKEL
ncbi:hypothetical protein J416_04688 [Gracilibacillus halophilus YIM-C55.5]|uniref:Uncharacterized protein n=1 Tax=Gracilibacillus halophilus YIM-C55.5 TaxID=1308866 RepID=N4WW16_9BACI|nr:DUF6501 family protein [Gracilibacillus halophilus]ENH97286.1 hypothetical protein J416_04688 [Gracilibacillus halophilus YIM-C55.5]